MMYLLQKVGVLSYERERNGEGRHSLVEDRVKILDELKSYRKGCFVSLVATRLSIRRRQ